MQAYRKAQTPPPPVPQVCGANPNARIESNRPDRVLSGLFFMSGIAVVGTAGAAVQVDDFPGVIELGVAVPVPPQGGPVRMETVADDRRNVGLDVREGVKSNAY